jgi:hypothetical protein
MTKVNIDIHTYQSREPYDDGWDRGDTNGSVERVYIANKDSDYSYRGFETDLEPPFYVVYASYYTGNTFGSDFEACIVGVTKTEDEAIALKTEAREFKGFGELSNGFYVPWNGYFESLIDVYHERLA